MTGSPRERVTNQPLGFFLVVGGKDPLKEPVKATQEKLAEHRYPVIYREVPEMGHQYIDGGPGVPVLDELVRWLDSLDWL